MKKETALIRVNKETQLLLAEIRKVKGVIPGHLIEELIQEWAAKNITK